VKSLIEVKNAVVRIIPPSELEFTYARSSGPGGQNVNKTSSKAILRWSLVDSEWVPDDVRERFKATFASRLTSEGDVVIHSDESRDRTTNERACIEKLQDMLEKVWTPPKKRVKTKPSRSSQRKRVETKRQRSDVKKGRQRVKID
jgi:ribosome-associated protein